MTALQTINLGTAPAGTDGDTVRSAFVKQNSNIAVLTAQAALTSGATLTSVRNLTTSDVGTRVNFNLPSGSTVRLPSSASCTADSILCLRNLSPYAVTLAAASGTSDTIGQTVLDAYSTMVMDTPAAGSWAVLYRGRGYSANETVDGTLTVAGGIAGDLPVSGKVSARSSPNLLVNGSGELGMSRWTSAYFTSAQDPTTGNASYFTNTGPLTGTSQYDYSPFVPVTPGTPIALQGILDTSGLTAGTANVGVEFRDGSGTLISVLGMSPSYGTSAALYTARGSAPAGTTQMRFRIGVSSSPVGPAGAVRYSNLKYEGGTAPSIYSQEASIAYLQSAMVGAGAAVYSNVTSSRTIGTTYTNSTARPLYVLAEIAAPATQAAVAVLRVNGGEVANFYNQSGASGIYGTLAAVVPPGATYAVTTASAFSLTNWSEY